MKYLKVAAVALSAAATSASAQANAQDGAHDGGAILLADKMRDDQITVVATGMNAPLLESGQAISVIGADEIASIQGPDLTRVLERLPGVTMTRNGGPGSFTGLRVRGAGAEQVLVLVDGVRVADVAAPGGGFDFGNLMTGAIDRVELLRGSNSIVWGSEAIGGVVAISTLRADGVRARAEYGARESYDAQASGGISNERYAIDIDGGYTRSDGYSTAATGSEDDGYRQWRVGGKAKMALAEGLWLNASARHADSRLDVDGYPAPNYVFADTAEYQDTKQTSGRAGIAWQGDGLTVDAGYALSDTRRDYFDPTIGSDPTYGTRGRSQRAELRGKWDLATRWNISFGADHEWSRFSTTYNARRKAELSSGHALLGYHGGGINLSAGARVDNHSRFNSKVTLGANGSIDIADGWRIRASYGEGFKAPTLYQLFSDYGNEALLPERSRSYDAGIEFGDRHEDVLFAALSAFRRDTRQMIDYVSCFSATDPLCADGRYGFYANVGKARAQGVELELGARVSERLRAQAIYSYVKATDRTPGGASRGNDLARRPRHAVTVSMDWKSPLAGLALGGDIRMVSDSFDDVGNYTRIDGFAIGTLRASLPINDAIELYGRVENVTDAQYVTVAGYGTPGRSAFIGARTRF